MNEETRASRGATAGLRKAFLAARPETYASTPCALQARTVAHRFGLSPAAARAVAELAFAVPETWGSRA